MGKAQFRVDIDANTDFCEIGDDGLPYWVRVDGSRELVTDSEQARRLLEAAAAYGYSVNSEEDVLKDTSFMRSKRGELTVGDLLGESQGPPGVTVTEPPAPPGEVDLSKTSYFVRGKELTVGDLRGQKQSPPREEGR